MDKKERLIIYPIAIILFLVIDGIWIKFLMKDLYLEQLRPILLGSGNEIEIRIVPAILSYASIYGLYVIVVLSKLRQMNFFSALSLSFVSGFMVYGAYDFTCLALFKPFNYGLAIIDALWGGVLYALVSSIIFFIQKKTNLIN